jgi:hypothetical protein
MANGDEDAGRRDRRRANWGTLLVGANARRRRGAIRGADFEEAMVENCALDCEVAGCGRRRSRKRKKALDFLVMVVFGSIKKVAALHVILPVRYLERWSVRMGS